MFGRLLWQIASREPRTLGGGAGRGDSGAAVISALLNLDFDIERKLTQEFRMLGAEPGDFSRSAAHDRRTPDAASGSSRSADVNGREPLSLATIEIDELRTSSAAAPYLYVVARAADTPVVVAGTWLDEARKLEPTWKLEGDWIARAKTKRAAWSAATWRGSFSLRRAASSN